MSEAKPSKKKPPLKVTCTSSDCASGRHAFRPTRDMRGTDAEGACRACHEHLIEWDRVHACDLDDVDFTFRSLRVELIRHFFWHVEFPQRAVDYATRKGWSGLRARIPIQIRSLIGSAAPFRDGAQTPRETSSGVNPIHLGQHATASCCRKCAKDWHGITQGRELTEGEIEYLSELALRFLKERLPHLAEKGKKVPVRK